MNLFKIISIAMFVVWLSVELVMADEDDEESQVPDRPDINNQWFAEPLKEGEPVPERVGRFVWNRAAGDDDNVTGDDELIESVCPIVEVHLNNIHEKYWMPQGIACEFDFPNEHFTYPEWQRLSAEAGWAFYYEAYVENKLSFSPGARKKKNLKAEAIERRRKLVYSNQVDLRITRFDINNDGKLENLFLNSAFFAKPVFTTYGRGEAMPLAMPHQSCGYKRRTLNERKSEEERQKAKDEIKHLPRLGLSTRNGGGLHPYLMHEDGPYMVEKENVSTIFRHKDFSFIGNWVSTLDAWVSPIQDDMAFWIFHVNKLANSRGLKPFDDGHANIGVCEIYYTTE